MKFDTLKQARQNAIMQTTQTNVKHKAIPDKYWSMRLNKYVYNYTIILSH